MAFENLKSTGIKYVLTKLKDVFLQIKDAVKTVNGEEADENGNIEINTVPFAQNLESESSQRNYDSFIVRTSGGESSIDSGDAWLMNIKGNSIHEGFVPESLEMIVSAIERENPITATIDRDTFVSYVQDSGTITLIYSSEWTSDPALYGITVVGTPENGDIITINYVKESRGTITVANPSAFNATGWNLYNSTLGYARVVKYSHGYKISGNFTALQYSSTVSGEKTTIQVIDGNFDIPSDGYVWVTGGGSNTAIWLTWTDWTESANNGEYEGHTESSVDLSSVMSTYFPNGLMKVGNTSDEIDLNLGQVRIRIDRMEYNAENLAIAKASGREYDYDENYIYLAKASEITQSVTIDGSFITSDHGIDYFASTEVEVETQILYGNNLKNKLERDVLTISSQSLTSSQQAQVRSNLGLGASSTKNVANNLTTASSGSAVLDAYQGKLLSEKVTLFDGLIGVDAKIDKESALTHILTLPSLSRTLVIFAGNASVERFWMGYVYVTNAGAIRLHEIDKGTYVTASIPDGTTNQLKFTLDSANTARIRTISIFGTSSAT